MSIADSRAGGTESDVRPRFSLVVAVYNTAGHLPQFIESVDRQSFDLDRVEVIAIDDGSTDDSAAILRAWAERRPDLVTVLAQPNAGQAAARNRGLEVARGEWVSFPDPDDLMRPGYLAGVQNFLAKFPETVLVGTNRQLLMDRTGQVVDRDPMRRMFRGGNQLVDIDRFPEFVHNSTATGFFRTDTIAAQGLRFDVRLRPVFEDAHFCIRYLLGCERRLVGFVKWAQYVHRTVPGAGPVLPAGVTAADRFLAVPRYGYLDVLERAAGPDGGRVPEWLQNLIVYDLSFLFGSDVDSSVLDPEVADEAMDLLRRTVALLDPFVIDGFDIKRFDRLGRDILLHGLTGADWVTPYAVVQARDEPKHLVRVSYRYTGTPPEELVLFRGLPFTVEFGKIRDIEHFGRPVMFERTMWLPANGTLRIVIDGVPTNLQKGWQARSVTVARANQLLTWFSAPEPPPAEPEPSPEVVRLLKRADSGRVQRRYHDAWLLMDRIHDAGDNGERLFRYLRAHRRDINAWFVIERDTPDWYRLRKEGYGSRLLAHGSTEWTLAMLNCTRLASSHIDAAVHRPQEIMGLRPVTWKFAFLQHGIIHNDLSRWLNTKQLDLVVTSTPGEYQSLAGDHSRYLWTSKEVRRTGLPRYDRLRDLGAAVPAPARDLLLICPTWRQWLIAPLEPGSQRRSIGGAFFDSEYWQQWHGLLSDPRLAELADRAKLRIGFLPHPNLQAALPQMSLPGHVEALSWVTDDVQRLLATSAALVTDYSSVAFDAAYIDRPVVYFQFDHARFHDGSHVARQGYFDYRRDGLGPVTDSIDRTVDELEAAVVAGAGHPAAVYRERIAATFPERDGRCCERVTAAMEDLVPRLPKNTLTSNAVHWLDGSPKIRRFTSDPVRRVARSRALARLRD